MSEIILDAAAADALGGATDAELDFTYPAIGETPYHTTLYRLLQRLASAVKAANQLRVYKDGELSFGVRPGRASRGAAQYPYAGCAGRPLADNQTSCVYLTIGAGVLELQVADEFPDAAVVPHLPLATLDTGTASLAGVSGRYDHEDITDLRGAAMMRVIGS